MQTIHFPEFAVRGTESFVRNSGRYFHGTTGREYRPRLSVAEPLPSSAYLYWALEESGRSAEYHELLRALQEYTGVGVNAFSVKRLAEGLAVEIYVTMWPPLLEDMLGRELPHMKRSRQDPDLNYFLGFEQEFFSQPRTTYDQDRLGLTYLFAAHFDLGERIFRERRIPDYTLSVKVTPERTLPERPGLWKGYLWDKTDAPLVHEQNGFVVDPVRHEREMLEFLSEALAREGWPNGVAVSPRDFLVGWLFEHTRDRHQLLGLTHKPMKGGLGVYYRLDFDALVRFLGEHDWPEGFRRDIQQNRDRLEHLEFDVAIAYRVSDGSIRPLRTALYGMV